MSVTSIGKLTDDALAVLTGASESRQDLEDCIKELSLRLMPKLRAFALSLDLGGAESEHAAQTVFDESILRLCRQYDPKTGPFLSYALSTLRRELKHYKETEWSDIHIPHNIRRKHRHVHQLAKEYSASPMIMESIAKETKQSPSYVRFLLSVDNIDTLSRSSHPEDITKCLDENGLLYEDEDPFEKAEEEAALNSLMSEFDRILTPVEKYVFCRKTGLKGGYEADCVTIQKELTDRFQVSYKNPSSISMHYQSALRKLRDSYTREELKKRFR